MSVRLKHAAKALRARYGVAGGVRPAKNGETCTTKFHAKITLPGKEPFETDVVCGERAHVISAGVPQCYDCMKRAHKRNHDQKLPREPYGVIKFEGDFIHGRYDGAVDERMSDLWKKARAQATIARGLEKVRRET